MGFVGGNSGSSGEKAGSRIAGGVGDEIKWEVIAGESGKRDIVGEKWAVVAGERWEMDLVCGEWASSRQEVKNSGREVGNRIMCAGSRQ